MKYLLIFLFTLMNCGIDSDSINPPKRWNLWEPIYIKNELEIRPDKDQLLFTGMRNAIINAGGSISELPVKQVLIIKSTNEENCKRSTTRAFTHFPTNGIINFCTNFALSMTYDEASATNTAMHELFHQFSNRDDHLDCTTERPIMAATADCSNNRTTYSEADKIYCGTKGYTIGGNCKK